MFILFFSNQPLNNQQDDIVFIYCKIEGILFSFLLDTHVHLLLQLCSCWASFKFGHFLWSNCMTSFLLYTVQQNTRLKLKFLTSTCDISGCVFLSKFEREVTKLGPYPTIIWVFLDLKLNRGQHCFKLKY